MKRKIVSTVALAALLATMLAIPAQAATEDEVEQAVTDGVAWLAAQQNADGSWNTWDYAAHTGLVLVKLQERGYELADDDPAIDDPFDPDYEYSDEIIKGWEYIFGSGTFTQLLSSQDHTAGASGAVDEPDTDGNGYGVYFGPTQINTNTRLSSCRACASSLMMNAHICSLLG